MRILLCLGIVSHGPPSHGRSRVCVADPGSLAEGMRATAMRKYLRFLLFLPLFVCFLALAKPVRVSAGDDWQPISPDDLALKDNPKSPGADAMILYRES